MILLTQSSWTFGQLGYVWLNSSSSSSSSSKCRHCQSQSLHLDSWTFGHLWLSKFTSPTWSWLLSHKFPNHQDAKADCSSSPVRHHADVVLLLFCLLMGSIQPRCTHWSFYYWHVRDHDCSTRCSNCRITANCADHRKYWWMSDVVLALDIRRFLPKVWDRSIADMRHIPSQLWHKCASCVAFPTATD